MTPASSTSTVSCSTPPTSAPKGGEHTGPSPVGRRKPGTKLHLLSDANGLPLVVGISAANVHDSDGLKPMVAGPQNAIRSHRGPCFKPQRLHADILHELRRPLLSSRHRGPAQTVEGGAGRGRDTSLSAPTLFRPTAIDQEGVSRERPSGSAQGKAVSVFAYRGSPRAAARQPAPGARSRSTPRRRPTARPLTADATATESETDRRLSPAPRSAPTSQPDPTPAPHTPTPPTRSLVPRPHLAGRTPHR